MRSLMDSVLNRYGVDAMLRTATTARPLKVFFHSVNSSNWQNMERMFFDLGEIPRGQYICVMPADAAAMPEDTLELGGKSYLLRKVEKMALAESSVYCWGLCVEKGREDTWGLNG